MNKSFGLGRAHEVLIWDLGWLERCELLLTIGPGKQTQKKVEGSQANTISKQQEKKRVDTVLLRRAVRKERKEEENECSKIYVKIYTCTLEACAKI
jgi:hypothetical protein